MERVANYRDRLATYTKSARHWRVRVMVIVVATLHILANVFIIIRGYAQGSYREESMFRLTLVYWIAATLVFWTIVYLVCRFTIPFFRRQE